MSAARAWSFGYYLAAVIAGAGFLWIGVALACEALDRRHGIGIDDDVTLLAIPLGALLAILVARALRGRSRLLLVLIVVGAAFALLNVLIAVWACRESERLQGSGMFAGLGEFLGALLAAAISLIGLSLSAMGWCGHRAARASPAPR